VDHKAQVKALMRRSALGRAYLEERRRATRPVWWDRNRRDERAIVVVIATVLRRSGNAIDIGANGGQILRPIQRRAPDGHHIAFEPLPSRAASLRSDFPRVDVREIALSDEAGEATFLHAIDADAFSSLEGHSRALSALRTDALTVQTARLDDTLPAGYRPDLIKIDVEGAEAHVLRGAVETLRASHPVIILEHGGAGAGQTRPAEIHPLLVGCGYDVFDIDGDGPYSLARMEETFERQDLWNWLAVPH